MLGLSFAGNSIDPGAGLLTVLDIDITDFSGCLSDIVVSSPYAEELDFDKLAMENPFVIRQDVIDAFADSYVRGETPIPCVLCNQTVKFRDLLKTAKELQGDALATGHYIRRTGTSGHAELYRAADPARDQSYFLFATTQEQADFLRFPL